MVRKLLAMCLFSVSLLSFTALAQPAVSAPKAILMDGKTGLVLYEKNAYETAYPASTTKIMTAILALEKGNLSDMVTVSFDAVNSISYDSSKAGLFEGEVFSMEELVYTLMICSANDSANVIAEHIGGSVEGFVEMMNARAKELGAKNTHFVNAHGLHNENHYTTAYDLAILAKHALSLPRFREIVSMRSYQLAPSEKCEEIRYINSTNHLLNPQSPYYHSTAIGIKTGYTDNAKSCLISASEKNGATYIAVVMGAENVDGQAMSFVDSGRLLSYGEETLKPTILSTMGTKTKGIPIKKARGTKEVPVITQETVSAILPEGVSPDAVKPMEYIKTDLTAPVKAGEILGRVDYMYGETRVGKTYLVASEDIKKETVFGWLFSKVWIYIVLLFILAIFLLRCTRKLRAKRKRVRSAEIRRRNKYQ